MDTDSSIYDTSTPSINLGKTDKPFNFFMFVLLIIAFFIIIIPWDKLSSKNVKQENREGMSGGTLTQLFAQDAQDVYLKSNVDGIATGDYNLMFNDPTRITYSFQNRGSPLPSIYLPDTSMNPNKNYPIVGSNNYVDTALNKRAKPYEPNKPYKRCVGNKCGAKNKAKSETKTETKTFPNPLITPETRDYERVGTKVISDVNSDANFNTNSNLIMPSNPTKYPNAVPTIKQDVLPSTLNMPENPSKPPNPYELAFVAKQVAKTEETANNLPAITEWTPQDYLFQAYYDNLLYNKDFIKDPANAGGGAGGFRLGEDFNQPSKAKTFVSIDGKLLYPNDYVGSLWLEPNFDISKPYPFMPTSNLPPSPIKMG